MPRTLRKSAQQQWLGGTLRWSLPLFGLVMILTMWGGVYWLLTSDRHRTEQEALARAAGSTQAYEAHLQQLLQQVDQLTAFVALNAETLGTTFDLNRLARQTLANQPALRSIYVVNESGDVIAVAMDNPPATAYNNVADRRYFQVHRAGHPNPLYVGEPIKGRISNQWVVHLSRARKHPDGSFAGVVVTTVDPAFLTNFYNEAQFGKQGLVSLVGLDWVVRSRRSGDRSWFGGSGGQNFLAKEVAKAPTGTYAAGSQIDGIERFMAYRVMPQYQLVAYTGLSQAEVFRNYEARRSAVLAFFAVATVVVLAAFGAFFYLQTRLRDTSQQADESARRFTAASDAQLDAFFILAAQRSPDGRLQDFRCEHANRRAAEWLNMPLSEIERVKATELIPAEHRLRLFSGYCTVVDTRTPMVEEFTVEQDGTTVHVVQQVVPVGDGVAITMRDVTAVRLKEAELLQSRAALAHNEARLRGVTNNLPVLISYLDNTLTVRFVNETYERWFGRNLNSSENTPLRTHWDDEIFNQRVPYIMKAMGGELVEFVAQRTTLAGPRVLQNTYVPDRDDSGSVRGIYMMSTDITELKRVEAELQSLLHTDTLTGLANRRGFNERLTEALARAARNQRGLAVMYIDVDKFKDVNDTHGHSVGDQILVEVARRLRLSIRLTDMVARIAGDEFVLILEDMTNALETDFVARKVIKQFEQGVPTDVGEVTVTVSVGVAYDEGGTKTQKTLLAEADKALYASKAHGRNRFTLAG